MWAFPFELILNHWPSSSQRFFIVSEQGILVQWLVILCVKGSMNNSLVLPETVIGSSLQQLVLLLMFASMGLQMN